MWLATTRFPHLASLVGEDALGATELNDLGVDPALGQFGVTAMGEPAFDVCNLSAGDISWLGLGGA